MINKINASIIILILVMLSLIGCQKYNLTVESGEGSGDYEKGEVVEIIADKAKIGYQFYRWTGDYQYLQDRYEAKTNIKMEKTSILIKAEYVSIDKTYSLSILDGTGSGDYLPGDDVRIFADQIDPPEEFYRWITDCNLEDLNILSNDLLKNEIVIKMPKRDVTISAQFDILYNVIIMHGTGSGKYPKDSIVTIKANQAENGYVFDSWVGDTSILSDSTKENIKFSMPEMNVELEATYKLEPKYELKIINGLGSGTFKAGTKHRITANTEQNGYVFIGWIGDTEILLNGVNYKTYIITMPARNITLEATYEKIPDYLVTVNKGTGDGRYREGEVVSIKADNAEDGFSFSRWEGDVSLLDDQYNPSTTFIMPAKQILLDATYEKVSDFLVTINNGTGGGRYRAGEIVNIEANQASEGFIFSHWEGDTSLLEDKLDPSSTFVMPNKSVTMVAKYSKIPDNEWAEEIKDINVNYQLQVVTILGIDYNKDWILEAEMKGISFNFRERIIGERGDSSSLDIWLEGSALAFRLSNKKIWFMKNFVGGLGHKPYPSMQDHWAETTNGNYNRGDHKIRIEYSLSKNECKLLWDDVLVGHWEIKKESNISPMNKIKVGNMKSITIRYKYLE